MRAVSRLLAAVKPAQYLEAGAPTGLTGLITHPSPRSSLLYLYHSTLDKLNEMPESSIYRQSTEALTKHRLKIIESVKPKGYEEWQQYVQMQIADDPEGFVQEDTTGGTRVIPATSEVIDSRLKASEWDGERSRSIPEGIRSSRDRQTLGYHTTKHNIDRKFKDIKLQREPPLTAEQ
jgi:NADH dehydrogenase (ubiquinone) 1 alpha subcomplex subunit 5